MRIEIHLSESSNYATAHVTRSWFLKRMSVEVWEGRYFCRNSVRQPAWIWTRNGVLAPPRLDRKLSRRMAIAGLF